MTTLPITLKEEHQDFIVSAVSSGSYLTQSEVVAAALDLLKAREELRHYRRTEVIREIQKGIDQLERGETSHFKADDVKAEGRRVLAGTARK